MSSANSVPDDATFTCALNSRWVQRGNRAPTQNRIGAYLRFAVKSTRGSFHPFTFCSFSFHCPLAFHRAIRSRPVYYYTRCMYIPSFSFSFSPPLSRKRERERRLNRERSLLRLTTTANKHLESPELQAREDDRDSRSVRIRTGFPRKIRWGIRKISTPPQFNLLIINKNNIRRLLSIIVMIFLFFYQCIFYLINMLIINFMGLCVCVPPVYTWKPAFHARIIRKNYDILKIKKGYKYKIFEN